MSDLIERNAAINALEEHRALFCDNTPESFSRLALEDKARVDEIDNAIATLVNLPSAEQMGWTPTSVRPPKEFEYVLVQLSWGGYELTQYIPPRIKPKYKDGYWGESDSVDYDYFEVVAWRPLPEPYKEIEKMSEDLISRQAAIHTIMGQPPEPHYPSWYAEQIKALPPIQPERKWTPCNNPPKHHKDVIVRGIEAIGNVTVHKVMQWDVDTWRPTNYAPSIIWKEWSEI